MDGYNSLNYQTTTNLNTVSLDELIIPSVSNKILQTDSDGVISGVIDADGILQSDGAGNYTFGDIPGSDINFNFTNGDKVLKSNTNKRDISETVWTTSGTYDDMTNTSAEISCKKIKLSSNDGNDAVEIGSMSIDQIQTISFQNLNHPTTDAAYISVGSGVNNSMEIKTYGTGGIELDSSAGSHVINANGNGKIVDFRFNNVSVGSISETGELHCVGATISTLPYFDTNKDLNSSNWTCTSGNNLTNTAAEISCKKVKLNNAETNLKLLTTNTSDYIAETAWTIASDGNNLTNTAANISCKNITSSTQLTANEIDATNIESGAIHSDSISDIAGNYNIAPFGTKCDLTLSDYLQINGSDFVDAARNVYAENVYCDIFGADSTHTNLQLFTDSTTAFNGFTTSANKTIAYAEPTTKKLKNSTTNYIDSNDNMVSDGFISNDFTTGTNYLLVSNVTTKKIEQSNFYIESNRLIINNPTGACSIELGGAVTQNKYIDFFTTTTFPDYLYRLILGSNTTDFTYQMAQTGGSVYNFNRNENSNFYWKIWDTTYAPSGNYRNKLQITNTIFKISNDYIYISDKAETTNYLTVNSTQFNVNTPNFTVANSSVLKLEITSSLTAHYTDLFIVNNAAGTNMLSTNATNVLIEKIMKMYDFGDNQPVDDEIYLIGINNDDEIVKSTSPLKYSNFNNTYKKPYFLSQSLSSQSVTSSVWSILTFTGTMYESDPYALKYNTTTLQLNASKYYNFIVDVRASDSSVQQLGIKYEFSPDNSTWYSAYESWQGVNSVSTPRQNTQLNCGHYTDTTNIYIKFYIYQTSGSSIATYYVYVQEI